MKDYHDYLRLSEQECRELAESLFVTVKDVDEIESILLHLSLFTTGECLKPLYPKLIDKLYFYPPEIFKHADCSIADRLIQLAETGKYNTNHLLICLAWIGTDNVVDFFIKSSKTKPKWAQKLHVLPKEYADQAGWSIDEGGKKRMLVNPEARAFLKAKDCPPNKPALPTFSPQEHACPFCKGKLTDVFTTDIGNKPVTFSACLLCSCYEPLFMKIGSKGESIWHEKNKMWEHFDDSLEMDPIQENTLVLSCEQRNPACSISQFAHISKSQIGGYPTWVQDAEYLNCPDCGSKMDFVGQIDMEDVEEYGEGIYYFQHCRKCSVTGVNYQQS